MGPHKVVWGIIKLYGASYTVVVLGLIKLYGASYSCMGTHKVVWGLISMVILDLSNLVLRSLSFGNSKFAKPAAKFVAQFHDNFEQNKL